MMVLWDKISLKAIKIFLTSSPGGKYDVIKPFLVSFQVKLRVSLIFCPMELKFGTGVNSEALISNDALYNYTKSQKVSSVY